ncbi:uncharacterized protein [Anoplolepis gracilipes]|uniref:uncharacterized protein n=1 Tax=Anoplolepis gracilipes TaxID=354296 RepID=UPI003B9F2956
MTRRGCPSLIQTCAYLAFFATVVIGQEECDKTKCPGPLAYYEALGCTPVYKKEDNCCATKYNCDHLKERSKTKCYVNGKEYEIGQPLKEEDANPCDVSCTCRSGYDGIAAFNCAEVDCFFGRVKPGCYRKHSPSLCCPEEICPENLGERPTCNVNGKIYQDGEYFKVESDPDLNCVCQEGYQGENVEPFCMKPKRSYCSPDFRDASDIFNKCAPVYYSSQAPQTSCSVFSRCQNNNDTVVHKEDGSKSADKTSNDEDVCYFGNLNMHVGDELNQATDYSSGCIKCVCEIPPVPTCQRFSNNECDVTQHPPFQF